MEKRCTGCEEVKPLTEFSFDRRRSDGRQSRCRACFNAYKLIYKQKYPERYKASKARDYQVHKEQRRATNRAWALANLDKIRAAQERHKADPEFRERRRKSSTRYREANREAAQARIAAWRKKNRSKATEYQQQRRARKRAVAWEEIDIMVLAERDGWVCGICSEPIDPACQHPDPLSKSVDHVLPLVFGGSHTYANVRLAHVACNVKRGAARGENLADLQSIPPRTGCLSWLVGLGSLLAVVLVARSPLLSWLEGRLMDWLVPDSAITAWG